MFPGNILFGYYTHWSHVVVSLTIVAVVVVAAAVVVVVVVVDVIGVVMMICLLVLVFVDAKVAALLLSTSVSGCLHLNRRA